MSKQPNMCRNQATKPSAAKQCTGDARNAFSKCFEDILSAVTPFLLEHVDTDMDECLEWLKAVMRYNVPHGKQIRGRLVESSYTTLAGSTYSEENKKLACVLGWCVEILQACFLVADDIMDHGVTRRGRKCWYRVNNMGNIAFNDAFLLEHIALQLIRVHFRGTEIYTEILDLVLGVTFRTMLGQSLDTRMSKDRNFDKFNKSVYDNISKYKTSYYTVYLPIALAMMLAGISKRDMKLFQKLEAISVEIGNLFQIQDDFLDCFAAERELGKHGTDIQEGKCTWLFVTARQKCSPDELNILKTNYGSEERHKVEVVRGIYEKLGMPELFDECQEKLVDDILHDIENLNHEKLEVVLKSVIGSIYKRKF